MPSAIGYLTLTSKVGGGHINVTGQCMKVLSQNFPRSAPPQNKILDPPLPERHARVVIAIS